MAVINITADAAKADSELAAFENKLAAVGQRLTTVTDKFVSFNAAGEPVSQTLKGLTAAGQKVTATFTTLKDATGKLLTQLDRINYSEKTEDVNALAKGHTALESAVNRVGRALQYFVAYRAFSTITKEIEAGVKAANEFQIQLSLIRTISQDKQLSPGQFGAAIRGVSDKTGIGVNEAAKAFYDTTSNQIAKGAEVAPFVQSAGDLAKVVGSTLPDAVNLLSSAINAYGLTAKDAEAISAVFFRTIDDGRIVASELANTYGRVVVLGQNLGVSYQDVNATLAVTTQKGLKTADAITLLTNLLIKLEKPTTATAGFFKSLGVDSGEAAIQLYGFTGVLQKMVDAVKSGQVDVSAFFDEIRGRKQFAVFQQSIDQIAKLSDSYKDTAKSIGIYNQAKAIRGESSAQVLNEEINKLKNVFTVELGQKVLDFSANLVKLFDATSLVSGSANRLGEAFTYVGGAAALYGTALIVYNTRTIAATTYTALFGASVNSLGGSVATTGTALSTFVSTFLIPFTVGYVTAKGIIDSNKLTPDLGSADIILEAARKIKEANQALIVNSVGSDRYTSGLDVAKEGYKDLLGIIAQLTIANNKFLDDSKTKSAAAGETFKFAFEAYINGIKTSVNAAKSDITKLNTELEKSSKYQVDFKSTIESLLNETQQKYATDPQKITLNENRIADLTKQADALFAQGTDESIAKARDFYKEVARLIKQNFDLQTDYNNKLTAEDIKNDPRNAGRPNVITVSTDQLKQRLLDLNAKVERLENERRGTIARTSTDKLLGVDASQDKINKLEAAYKDLAKLSPINDKGEIVSKYKDSAGKFDQAKFNKDAEAYSEKLRSLAGTDGAARIQLEITLFEYKKKLITEASAIQRAADLKNAEVKQNTDLEAYKETLKGFKTIREKATIDQTEAFKQLDAGAGQLKSIYNNAKVPSFPFVKVSTSKEEVAAKDEALKAKKRLQTSIDDYQKSLLALRGSGQQQADGSVLFDPVKLAEVEKQYKAIEADLLSIAKYNNRAVTGVDNGKEVTLGAVTGTTRQGFNNLKDTNTELDAAKQREDVARSQLRDNVLDPLNALTLKFPEVSIAALNAATATKASFNEIDATIKTVTNSAIILRDILREINAGKAVGEKQSLGPLDSGNAAYAATGGIVGAFPGQPRGVDIYPIWAARGERIIDAKTSAEFAPILDVIMNRRSPQYFSQGGIVGSGDSIVGDINVTVNGGNTNSQTGEAIANAIERGIRRKTINLKGRR